MKIIQDFFLILGNPQKLQEVYFFFVFLMKTYYFLNLKYLETMKIFLPNFLIRKILKNAHKVFGNFKKLKVHDYLFITISLKFSYQILLDIFTLKDMEIFHFYSY